VAPPSLRPPGPPIGLADGPRLASSRWRHRRASEPPPQPNDPPGYETFYGLREKPFGPSPDLKFLYQSASHAQVSQELLSAIQRHEGIAVITGEAGVGKTMLCRAVSGQLDRRTLTSYVSRPFVSVDGLLETVLVDFGVMSHDDLPTDSRATREELTTTLRMFLGSLVALRANAVLIIDDAHTIPIEAQEELQVLLDLCDSPGLLQVILLGEPPLLDALAGSDLNDRVTCRAELLPLAADELPGYLLHYLATAGSSGRVEFTDAAFAALSERTGGVPRLVNEMADRALARGHHLSASVIDAAIVDPPFDDPEGAPASEPSRTVRIAIFALVLCILLLIGAAAAAWVFRDRMTVTIAEWVSMPPPPVGPALRLPRPLAPIPPDPES
jgi:general secretion pathway protein A